MGVRVGVGVGLIFDLEILKVCCCELELGF